MTQAFNHIMGLLSNQDSTEEKDRFSTAGALQRAGARGNIGAGLQDRCEPYGKGGSHSLQLDLASIPEMLGQPPLGHPRRPEAER